MVVAVSRGLSRIVGDLTFPRVANSSSIICNVFLKTDFQPYSLEVASPLKIMNYHLQELYGTIEEPNGKELDMISVPSLVMQLEQQESE